ncbi:MAG: hypothetical protein KBE91_00570 [Bacteroidia bacterium]|nr:hypothetical protein [Bacteroidia bacterium]MBP9688072.1 hypothetical protein [Bacteroidia bacterium]
MMKLQLFFALAGGLAITTSCNQQPKTPTNDVASNQEQVSNTAEHEESHEATEKLEINLNNGAKWAVNKEMMVYVRNSEGLVDTYINAPKKDYAALAKELNSTVGLLTKSCTMKGQSHEELHVWLHPYMQLIKDLGNAKNEEEASQIVNALQASFVMFNQYFE